MLEISPTLSIQLDASVEFGEIMASALEISLKNLPNTELCPYKNFSYHVTDTGVVLGSRVFCALIEDVLIVSLG